MEEKYSREKDRLGKIFNIATELDDDLKLAVSEMKARDDWYVAHMSLFEDLNKAIKERYEMIEKAVEAERKSQHMARAFDERMEEMVSARAAEMTIEEAEATATPVEKVKADEDKDYNEEEVDEAIEAAAEEVVAEEAVAEEPVEAEKTPEEPKADAPAPTWGDDSDPWADN